LSKREDIVDGKDAENRKYGLVYTRKCGWIDLGHAIPDEPLSLWNKVFTELHGKSDDKDYFTIEYEMRMRKRIFEDRYLSVGSRKTYQVKKGLTLSKKKSAALTIYLGVSHQFESMQSSIPYRWVTDSGYSAEDLISNLIAFYRAVEPGPSYINMCDPVSKAQTLAIWDKYGPVDSNKNYYLTPFLYPVEGDLMTSDGPQCAELPSFLLKIKPMPIGQELKSCILSGFNQYSCY
jgi:hypothetical protein